MATLTFEDYYNMNPIAVVDQNVWPDRVAEVIMQFQTGPVIYTPLIDWTNRSQTTGASQSIFTELLEGDVDFDEMTMAQMYVTDPSYVDSRKRELAVARYGDKVMLNKYSNIFQMWKMSGGRDWRPLLRGVLGNNVVRKIELISRNAYLKSPKTYWTYGGDATSIGTLVAADKFNIAIVNAWNLRLGNTGSPVIPGDSASVKVAIIPPGVIYDFFSSLAAASSNETSMWRDASIYQGKLRYEIGTYKNVRFVEVPNDKYGLNNSVLYNTGAIQYQTTVSKAITAGDGAPDPEALAVDEVWKVGQKDVDHFIELGSGTDMSQFNVNDIVTLHTVRTDAYGVSNGVDPLSGKTIHRRIVLKDTGGKTISFDRPVMKNYTTLLASNTYAYITKGLHIGFILVLGSRGGIMGNVNKPIEFYEPRPIDDYDSVWRYVWDIIAGWNIWEPNLFECHFVPVSLAKPGGIIVPTDPSS
jgi:hypothetical protein